MTEIVDEHVHVEGDPPCPGCGWHVAPKLIHAGTYALYETPGGGRHLAYQQRHAVDEHGQVQEVEVEDSHLPDIPPEALPLIGAWLEHGFPPAVLAMLGGKLNPMTLMKALRNGAGDGTG